MNSGKITNFELGTDETNDLLAKSHGVHDGEQTKAIQQSNCQQFYCKTVYCTVDGVTGPCSSN